MFSTLIILTKICHLLLLIAAGMAAKRFKLISETGERNMSELLIHIFWPAMIFVSITKELKYADLAANMVLPFLAVMTALTGLCLGAVAVHIMKYEGDRRKIFLYHSTINNFAFMVLPFAVAMVPGKGAALLFVHNTGYMVVLWTVGMFVLGGSCRMRDAVRNMMSVGLLATISAIAFVVLGLVGHIPGVVLNVLETLSGPTVAVAMIIAGAQIYTLGKTALRFDSWNILLGAVRLIFVPGMLFVVSYYLPLYLNATRDAIVIFMLVNIMPVSVNSISLAVKCGSSAEYAAQGVVFTHVFAIATMTVFIVFIEQMLMK